MKQCFLKVKETAAIADNVYRTVFTGDVSGVKVPGQFINVRIPELYLRRPISVCDKGDFDLTIIYKAIGKGTEALSRSAHGDVFDVLTGLGNGYDLSVSGNNPLIIGGALGVPPLFWLTKELVKQGKKVSVILGFNAKKDVFYEQEFRALGCNVTVATVDGSYGEKGFVTDVLPDSLSYYYACGPEQMLKAVYYAINGDGEFSFEARMGCGFGACMGCSCKTVYGSKRVCKDGPVFKKEEIVWNGIRG